MELQLICFIFASILLGAFVIVRASMKKNLYYEFRISYRDDGIQYNEVKLFDARKHYNKEIIEVRVPSLVQREPDVPVGKWFPLSTNLSSDVMRQLPKIDEEEYSSDICIEIKCLLCDSK